MDSLAPKNWATGRGGSRLRAPAMMVKVRWFSDDGPVSWEWRGAAKGQMYRSKTFYSAPNAIDYDGNIIMEKGTQIHKADFLIIDTAVRLEKRHQEWQDSECWLYRRKAGAGTPAL